MISVKEALNLVLKSTETLKSFEVQLEDSLNYFLAEDILSDRDYPPFNRSAMDGIALNYSDIVTGISSFQVVESIYPGEAATKVIDSGQCYKIMTGSSVPPTANTVIRIEDVNLQEGIAIIEYVKIKEGQNIAIKGEDINKGSIVVKKGTKITPTVIATLSTVGADKIKVYNPPTIQILTTGNEVKKANEAISEFQIRDSNGIYLKSALTDYRITANQSIVKDAKSDLLSSIQDGLNCDILILSGGVSMGDADYVPNTLEILGVKKLFHKVAQKPGKPIWFGKKDKTLVFGLPGNPVSVQVMFKVYIEPLLLKMFGSSSNYSIKYPIAHDYHKKGSFRNFIPSIVTQDGEISMVKYNGSGDINATSNATGLSVIPEDCNEIRKGDSLEFIPW